MHGTCTRCEKVADVDFCVNVQTKKSALLCRSCRGVMNRLLIADFFRGVWFRDLGLSFRDAVRGGAHRLINRGKEMVGGKRRKSRSKDMFLTWPD